MSKGARFCCKPATRRRIATVTPQREIKSIVPINKIFSGYAKLDLRKALQVAKERSNNTPY
jgi:hypothetical protein